MHVRNWIIPGLLVVLVGLGATFTSQNLIPGGGIMDQNGSPQVASQSFQFVSAAGPTTLIAAQATPLKIRLTSLACSPMSNVIWSLADTTNNLSASMPVLASAPLIWPFSPVGYLTTGASAPLILNQSVAASTGCLLGWMPTS